MLCCRPRLTGEGEQPTTEKGETTNKLHRVSTDNWKVISTHEKSRVSTDAKMRGYQTLDKNFKMARPHADHVKSAHAKPAGIPPRQQSLHEKSHVIYYKGEGQYKITSNPNARTTAGNISRSVSHSYKGVSIPRAKLHVNRSVSYKEPSAPKQYVVSLVHTGYGERLTKDVKTSDKVNVNKTTSSTPKPSVDSGADVDCDSGSFTEEQKNALDQLDDTLNEFNTGVFEEDTPVIVTDVLPYGVFEVDEKFDSGLESDELPSSRTSSLSSNKSLKAKGIISSTRPKSVRRPPSVSFDLPLDHVDKPYAPLQWNRAKSVPHPAHTITITDYKSKVTHTNGDQVFVEDKMARRSSGPFKGSFKKIFYGKYAPRDISSSDQGKFYVSPMILERVSSYESLNDERLMHEHSRRSSRREAVRK